jgi:acyl carrier protein
MTTIPERASIVALVTAALEDVLEQNGTTVAEPVSEETYLIGRRAVIDSLGIVTLIVDLEQRIDDEYGVALTLADERAMSQKNSPFLTVSTLTDYVIGLIGEERGNG